jgi:FtsZ-binding cell division protein ZapB
MEKCKTCANGYPSVSCVACGTGYRNYVEIGKTIEDYIRRSAEQSKGLKAYMDTGLTPEQIEAQQQEKNLLIMEITELRESNQALKDYAENADADKDEQAGRLMKMDYLLRRTLPILEVANNQQGLIEQINALLGGKEDA